MYTSIRSIDGSRILDLMPHFQDGCSDVISHSKVLTPGEWTRSLWRRLCSSFRQFLFLICSTFVLDLTTDLQCNVFPFPFRLYKCVSSSENVNRHS